MAGPSLSLQNGGFEECSILSRASVQGVQQNGQNCLNSSRPVDLYLFSSQVALYECSARVAGEDITGEVDVDSTQDYTGLVRDNIT